jgi:hypothetical protein
MEDRGLRTILLKSRKFLLKIFQELETFNTLHHFSQLSPLQCVEKMSQWAVIYVGKERDTTEHSGINPSVISTC